MKTQLILFLLLLITSCAVAEIDSESIQDNTKESTNLKMKKQGQGVAVDNELIQLHKEQSSKFMMMHDMLLQKDGHYYLPLTEKDAESLKINEGQYNQFQKYVESLNSEK